MANGQVHRPYQLIVRLIGYLYAVHYERVQAHYISQIEYHFSIGAITVGFSGFQRVHAQIFSRSVTISERQRLEAGKAKGLIKAIHRPSCFVFHGMTERHCQFRIANRFRWFVHSQVRVRHTCSHNSPWLQNPITFAHEGYSFIKKKMLEKVLGIDVRKRTVLKWQDVSLQIIELLEISRLAKMDIRLRLSAAGEPTPKPVPENPDDLGWRITNHFFLERQHAVAIVT